MRTATPVPECKPIGPLEAFVQDANGGAYAGSLHRLAGQLHAGAGDEGAREQWLMSVRERFAAVQAVCFDIDLRGREEQRVLSDPPHRVTHVPAVEAMVAKLQQCEPGHAVVLETEFKEESPLRLKAAAVRCEPARALGMVLVRNADAAHERDPAILDCVAGLAWHLQCAEAASAKVRAMSAHLAPVDLPSLLPVPCMITDSAGRTVERNELFTEMMDAAHLEVVTGRVRFSDPYLQNSWLVALAEVEATAVEQTLLVPAENGKEWCLHLTPVRYGTNAADTTGRPMILAIAEPHMPSPEIQLASSPEFDRPLTPAESDVLGAMLQGHSAKVIANSRGASVNTVRSQIMSILGKTGFNNQKSLIASFSTSVFGNSTSSNFQQSTNRRAVSERR